MNSKTNEIELLLTEIFDVLKAGHEADENENPLIKENLNSESKFGSIRIINKAKTIKGEEIILLEKAAINREKALVLLRQNHLTQGTKELIKTKQIIENVNLTKEANLIYSTYQAAAESFLCIKNNEYDEALVLMKNALETHKSLFLEFGHAIDARRIHLARNIARIMYVSNKETSSFQLSLQLLEYSISNKGTWPLTSCTLENPDDVSMYVKIFTINQLLKDINSILSNSQSDELIIYLENFINKLKKNTHIETPIVLNWLEAYYAIIRDDRIGFLKNALLFFQENNKSLPDANHSMLSLLGDNFLNSN